MLKLAAAATQESIQLEKESEELEMKIKYLKKVMYFSFIYVVIYTAPLCLQKHEQVVHIQALRPTG